MNNRHKKQITKTRRCFSRFPSKLKEILNVLNINNKSEIHKQCICWSEDGKKIIVKNKEELGRTVLPLYYKTDKVTTFIRQLNLFSFQHSQDEFHNQIYHHPQFTRDSSKVLLTRIKIIPKTLQKEHEELQQSISTLIQDQQILQQQFTALIKFNNKIATVQQGLVKVFIDLYRYFIGEWYTAKFWKLLSFGIYLVSETVSRNQGMTLVQHQTIKGSNVFKATVSFIEALEQNNDMYQEDSMNFYSTQISCGRIN